MLFTISTAMVIAGGLSNLIDRVLFKSVTDYLDLQGFAVFNFADCLITVGAFALIFYLIVDIIKDSERNKALKSNSTENDNGTN